MADDLRPILDAVRRGLSDYAREMAVYERNAAFYRMENACYLPKREGEEPRDFERRPRAYLYLTRRAIRCLTDRLYSPGPTRKADDPACDKFLADVYRSAHINALWQRLDRLATLDGYGAV